MRNLILITLAIALAAERGFAEPPSGVVLKNGKFLAGQVEIQGQEIFLEKGFGTLRFHKNDVLKIYGAKTPLKRDERFVQMLRRTRLAQLKPARKIQKRKTLYDPLIEKHAKRQSLEPALVKAVVYAESNFNPHTISSKGAKGLMQLMPSTAQSLGVKSIFDPTQNIAGGSRYLKSMMDTFNGDLGLALAGYNAGPNAVKRHKGIPPYKETRNYVERVTRAYRAYRPRLPIYWRMEKEGLVLTNVPLDSTFHRFQPR